MLFFHDMLQNNSVLMRLRRDDAGATAIEYGLIAALIAVAAIAAFQLVGTNLSSVVVLEQPGGGDPGGGLWSLLPSVSVSGASGRELVTSLGTVIRFVRGGVTYTVLGSMPKPVVEAVARGL